MSQANLALKFLLHKMANKNLSEFQQKIRLAKFPSTKFMTHGLEKNVLVNMDIGLIQIEDINDWTAQVNGIGQLGKLADLSVENISVKLVGCPVKAFGAASGILEGEIKALFYRYKA